MMFLFLTESLPCWDLFPLCLTQSGVQLKLSGNLCIDLEITGFGSSLSGGSSGTGRVEFKVVPCSWLLGVVIVTVSVVDFVLLREFDGVIFKLSLL